MSVIGLTKLNSLLDTAASEFDAWRQPNETESTKIGLITPSLLEKMPTGPVSSAALSATVPNALIETV